MTPSIRSAFTAAVYEFATHTLREAKGTPPTPALEKLKKPEIAALAEREIANTGWLPKPLRPPQ